MLCWQSDIKQKQLWIACPVRRSWFLNLCQEARALIAASPVTATIKASGSLGSEEVGVPHFLPASVPVR
jgi:hypothetical protein